MALCRNNLSHIQKEERYYQYIFVDDKYVKEECCVKKHII